MSDIGAMTGFGGASDTLTGLMNSWNQWTQGGNEVANAQAFSHSGIPTSTNATYADVGSLANTAYQTTRESDALRAANQQVANAQKGAVSSGVGALGSALGGLGGIV